MCAVNDNAANTLASSLVVQDVPSQYSSPWQVWRLPWLQSQVIGVGQSGSHATHQIPVALSIGVLLLYESK